MRIRAAYPYRTHWDDARMSDDDLAALGRRAWGTHRGRGGGPKEVSIARARQLLSCAREGTRLLANAGAEGVTFGAFELADWAFLASRTAPPVPEEHAAAAGPFGGEAGAKRSQLDGFTARVFDSYRGLGKGNRRVTTV